MDPAPKETPAKYCPSHGVWVAKASLRWVQILFGILTLALTGAISFGNEAGGELPFIIASPSVVLALLWDLSEAITIHRREAHRGISPPAVLVMDLIVWLALVGSNAGLGYIGMATDLNDVLYYPLSHDYKFNGVPADLEGAVQNVKNMALVVVVFMCLLTSLHISTFIIACYETHIRKKPPAPPAQPTTIVVMANPTSPPPAMVPQGQVYYQMAPPPPGHPPGQMYFVPVQGVPGTLAGQVVGDVKQGSQ